MITPGQSLGEVSEELLLQAILPLFPAHPDLLVGPGDDAAVLRCPGSVIATTDSMVRGRDWLDQWSGAGDVGRKLLTQNLADVAAMGGVPTSVLVTLAADPATPAQWAVDFARALAEGARQAGVAVAGGDLSSAPAGSLFVSVTALGDLQGRAPVLRSGARAGDQVALCGTLGRSAAGLALLQGGRAGGSADGSAGGSADGSAGTDLAEACLAHHRRPAAPLEAGPQAAASGATAMLDISDGLLLDGHRVARASGVRLELDGSVLGRLAAELAPAVGEEAAWDCVLAGGEEHSLLATFPAEVALPQGWARLGTVLEGAGVTVDGHPEPPRGWDHFAR